MVGDLGSVSINTIDTKSGEHYTSCSEYVTCALTHHSAKLPLLVMLINGFSHMATSQYALVNKTFIGQFYHIFYHFSCLGKEARHYMLRIKTLGRLMDLYFDKAS